MNSGFRLKFIITNRIVADIEGDPGQSLNSELS
jgi:hypothetical protein